MFCVVPDNIPTPFATAKYSHNLTCYVTVHTSSCQIHLIFRRVLNNDLVLEAVRRWPRFWALIWEHFPRDIGIYTWCSGLSALFSIMYMWRSYAGLSIPYTIRYDTIRYDIQWEWTGGPQ